MRDLLITFLSFADFWFFPLIVLFVLASVAEQIVKRITTSEMAVYQAMRIRRLLWQQNLFLNAIWLISWFGLNIMHRREVAMNDSFYVPGLMWRT